MDNGRNCFTFFRSFQEAIEQCEEKDQLALYRGIVSYALDEIEPTFDNPLLRLAWTLIKPNLENGWVRSRNGRQSSGVPKPGLIGNQNAKKDTNQSQNEAKTKLKQNNRNGMDRKGMERNNKETETKKEISLSISERKEAFKNELEQYREKYDANMLNDFFQYWTQPNKSKTKMQFEAEKFWDLKARLDAWKNRKFNK